MRFGRFVLLVSGLALAGAAPARAQYPPPIPAATPLHFESWRATSPAEVSGTLPVGDIAAGSRNRTRQALVGGAIGAGAGVVLCTVFSTLIDDSAKGGVSFCPLDTNLLMGAAGFVLGAAIGWAI